MIGERGSKGNKKSPFSTNGKEDGKNRVTTSFCLFLTKKTSPSTIIILSRANGRTRRRLLTKGVRGAANEMYSFFLTLPTCTNRRLSERYGKQLLVFAHRIYKRYYTTFFSVCQALFRKFLQICACKKRKFSLRKAL